MATATRVQLSTNDSGAFSAGARPDGAQTASEVLQEDLETHHVFFNDSGFHNHIVHHILSIYALGASPDAIREAYNRGKSYQRPARPVNEVVARELHDRSKFKECLGKEKHYPDYLAFFQREIDAKGVGDVLKEYLFAGDERADDLLARLFGGLLHPFIHLGFGIEFNQPAIVAEGLAQTAVHDNWVGPMYLLPAEKAAGGIGKPGAKTLAQLLEEIQADKKLADSVEWSDGNKIRDGVLKRAPEEMIKYASQFTVSENQIQEKHAEIISTVVYYTAAAQRPQKQIKFDFFLMHSLNSSIFLAKILALPSIDTRTKLRLLEWKGRMDLVVYVSRGAPKLYLEEVSRYQTQKDWNTIFARGIEHPRDDGHLAKLLRTVAHGEQVCRPFEGRAKELGLLVSGDMWLKIGNMIIDSVADERSMWVRSTGFDEAWKDFEDRSRL